MVILNAKVDKRDEKKKTKNLRKLKETDKTHAEDGGDDEFRVIAKSHEELEIEIQSARILYVLDEMCKKLEIASHLPYLIENDGSILRSYFPRSHVEFILDQCAKYVQDEVEETVDDNRSLYSNFDQVQPQPRFEETTMSPKETKLSIGISQVVDMMYTNETLLQTFNTWDYEIDEIFDILMKSAKSLRETAAKKLAVSALEERNRERRLRIAWKDNLEAKKLIKSIEEKVDKQKNELDVHINAKEEMIKMYNEKIDTLKEKFKENIKKRVTDSEKAMIKHSQESEECQIILAEKAKAANQSYNTLLEQHLASEKILRGKRYKIEAQLASWLAKYDADVGERQAEFEAITKLYEEEMEEMNALQAKYDEQEEDYVELMAERDEYEQRIYQEKAYIFLINRAARRIQKCWRDYRERKRLRKKAKKARAKEKKEKQDAKTTTMDFGEEQMAEEKTEKKGKKDKGKKDKGKKGKDKGEPGVDPNDEIESKFKGDVFEDISAEPMQTDVQLDL